MYEYILFHEKPFQLFVNWLKEKNIPVETEIEDSNYVIKIPEDLDDDLLDEIEDIYDEFMDMNEQIVNEEEKANPLNYHMAGITVTLKDGTVSHAEIEPDLMNRVISVISPSEFGDIVNAIADAVENPQPKTYCQRMREIDE